MNIEKPNDKRLKHNEFITWIYTMKKRSMGK